jgi:hypothetical protein
MQLPCAIKLRMEGWAFFPNMGTSCLASTLQLDGLYGTRDGSFDELCCNRLYHGLGRQVEDTFHAPVLEESERAIRTAVVQARVKEREAALEKDLRGRFPVKVDDAALASMPMPPPASAAPAVRAPPHGGLKTGDLRLPSLTKMAGIKPATATPAPAPAPAPAPQ